MVPRERHWGRQSHPTGIRIRRIDTIHNLLVPSVDLLSKLKFCFRGTWQNQEDTPRRQVTVESFSHFHALNRWSRTEATRDFNSQTNSLTTHYTAGDEQPVPGETSPLCNWLNRYSATSAIWWTLFIYPQDNNWPHEKSVGVIKLLFAFHGPQLQIYSGNHITNNVNYSIIPLFPRWSSICQFRLWASRTRIPLLLIDIPVDLNSLA